MIFLAKNEMDGAVVTIPLESRSNPEHGLDDLYQRALQLIGRHVADRMTLKEILAILGVSHYMLLRLFLARTGRTPNQEMARLRLQHAQSLLLTTQLPLKKIAIMCGFRRVSNFSDFFCRQTSLTPGAFRKRYRGVNVRKLTPVRNNGIEPKSESTTFE